MQPRLSPWPAAALWMSLTVVAAATMFASQQPPRVVSASAPPTEFSAERAFRHVVALAGEPRPIGTEAHALARAYILSELRELGLDPQVQATLVVDPQSAVDPAWSVAGNIQNVVARLRGTGGGHAILLLGHYDSVATGPGASDDAAGVATLLETTRALQAGPALKNDVILLFTDAEEVGLLGAMGFVEQHPWAKDVGLALNFDTGGDTGVVYTYQTSPGNAHLIAEYARAVPYPVASSMMDSVYRTMPNESDFTPLLKAGIAGFNFAHVGGKFRYHTLTDSTANLDLGSLQHQGSYALSLGRHFGDLDLTSLSSSDNLIYFNILGLGLMQYPEEWALPIAVAIALLFVGLVAVGWRRGQVTAVGLPLGAVTFGLVMLMCAGLAWVAWQGLVKLYPQYGAVVDTANGVFYWLAFCALAVAVTSSVYVLLRRYLRLGDLALGALFWWLIAMILASLQLPGASCWLAWPLLLSLIGLGLLWFLPERRLNPWRRAVLLAATALPMLLLVGWSPYAFYLTMGTDLIVLPVAIMVLLLGLLVPHLDQAARPHPWILPVCAGAVAAAALILGSLTAAPDAQRPQADSMLYALDVDTDQALWVSSDPETDAWTAQFLGTSYRTGDLPQLFPDSTQAYLFAPAPTLGLSPAQVDVVTDRTAGGRRTLDLHVTAPGDVSWVEVRINASSPITALTLAGTDISVETGVVQAPPNSYWHTFQFWLPPPEGFELSVEATSPGDVTVLVHTYRFGLPQIPGFQYDPRPADRMPLAREFLPKNKTDLAVAIASYTFDDKD